MKKRHRQFWRQVSKWCVFLQSTGPW